MSKEYLNVPFSIKSEDIQENGIFQGMASLFDNEPDAHSDLVARGSFLDTLAMGGRNKTGIMLGWQHDSRGMPPGVWLELRETPDGLFVKGQLSLKIQLGREAYEIMKLGAETGMWKFSLSIGYDSIEEEYKIIKLNDGTSKRLRVLKKISLYEISIVNFPAKLGSTITDVKHQIAAKEILPIKGGGQYSYCAKALDSLPDCGDTMGIPPAILRGFVHGLKQQNYSTEKICSMVGDLSNLAKSKDGKSDWPGVFKSLDDVRKLFDSNFNGLAMGFEALKKQVENFNIESKIENHSSFGDILPVIDSVNARINKATETVSNPVTKNAIALDNRINSLTDSFRENSRNRTSSTADEETNTSGPTEEQRLLRASLKRQNIELGSDAARHVLLGVD